MRAATPAESIRTALACGVLALGVCLATIYATPGDGYWIVDSGAKALMARRLLESGYTELDLGYLNAYVTYRLARKEISGKAGESFAAGRLGTVTTEPQEGADYGLIYLGSLFRFDKGNIAQFKDVF